MESFFLTCKLRQSCSADDAFNEASVDNLTGVDKEHCASMAFVVGKNKPLMTLRMRVSQIF